MDGHSHVVTDPQPPHTATATRTDHGCPLYAAPLSPLHGDTDGPRLVLDSDTCATMLEVEKRRRRRPSSGKQTSRRGWQSVREELIDLIVQRLPLFDRWSFSRVCKSWRTFYNTGFLFDNNIRGNRGTPWLTMGKGMYSPTVSKFCYSIMEDLCYELDKIPEGFGWNNKVWGYSGDWLLLGSDLVTIGSFLLNPFTGDRVNLPSFPAKEFHKLQVSSTPLNRDKNCVFMLLNCWMLPPGSSVYFWVLGAPQWVKLVGLLGVYMDVVYSQRRFYILSMDFTRVTVFDAEHVLSIVRSSKETATLDEMKGMTYVMNKPAGMSSSSSLRNIAYMVPSYDDDGGGGDVKFLLVHLANITPSSRCHIYVYKWDVSSANKDKACWVEVESLGDRVFFVSPVSSIWYSRGQLGKGISNNIFFANPCCHSNTLIFYCNYSSSGCKVDGWRKADMYKDCCKCFPPPFFWPGRFGVAGMWLNAPTWWYNTSAIKVRYPPSRLKDYLR